MYGLYFLVLVFSIVLWVAECRPNFAIVSPDTDTLDSVQTKGENSQEAHRNERVRRFVGDEYYSGEYYNENSSLFWNSRAQMAVRNHLLRQLNHNIAKNVILFLGDGMSIPTLTAARIYLGQKHGTSGEQSRLSFEEFPHVGLSKTYCVDRQVPDSACSATAYLCGVKGNIYTVGVNGRVKLNDCTASSMHANQVNSLADWAQRAGKAAGIVTTTTVTHASPSAAYAHSSNRNFECDADVSRLTNDTIDCQDIASQLVNNWPGNAFKVIFGGGRTKFIPNTEKDIDGNDGERLDGINLIEQWKRNRDGAQVVYDKVDLENLDLMQSEYVMGLFTAGHMNYNLEADRDKEPTLTEMTEAAVRILQKEENGYFLFVEGGRIDHGHHDAKAHKALDETVQFSEAIKRTVELTDREDTLIIVTSDHAHTMSISGYPNRGNDILGLSTIKSEIDGLPYTTLSYANGPGFNAVFYSVNGTRNDLSNTQFGKDYIYPGIFPLKSETHGGDDVGVFALGCMSHLFSGVYEQNTIPHLIGYAACIGDGLTACNQFS